MADDSYLIVGLGNPGRQYEYTRHNIGFLVLNLLARQHDLTFVESSWKASVASTDLWHGRIFFVKPDTFMNLSGTAVALFIALYRLPVERVIVIHDDIDLPLGRVKVVSNRGAGGHKGIESIIDCLGTKNFSRLKVGIGRPQSPQPIDRYVLSRFLPEEWLLIERKMSDIEEGLRLFCQEGVNAARSFVNATR